MDLSDGVRKVLAVVALILGLAAIFVITLVAEGGELTPLEAGLLQTLAVGLGVGGTLFVGHLSGRRSLLPWVRTHVRTVMTLGEGVGRTGELVDTFMAQLDSATDANGKVSAMVVKGDFRAIAASIEQIVPSGALVLSQLSDQWPKEVRHVLEAGAPTEQGGEHD